MDVRFLASFGVMGMCCLGSASSAAVVTLNGNVADNAIYYSPVNNSYYPGGASVNLDEVGYNGGLQRSFVFVFQLPERPADTAVTAGTFSAMATSIDKAYPVDLMGLPFRSTAQVELTDFYYGPAAAAPNASLLQAGFNASGVSNTRTTTLSAASSAIADYLNDQYDAGAEAGDYVFLRLSNSTGQGGPTNMNTWYAADLAPYLASAYSSGNPTLFAYYLNQFTNSHGPQLSLTFSPVPEPASVALLALAMPLLRRSRR